MGGKFIVKAGQHIFDAGQEVVTMPLRLPTFTPTQESHQFKIVDNHQHPIEDVDYLILDQNNVAYIGKTDDEGLTERVFSNKTNNLRVYYDNDAIEKLKELGLFNGK